VGARKCWGRRRQTVLREDRRIDVLADPERLRRLDLTVLDG
jgi:hypothetical protein